MSLAPMKTKAAIPMTATAKVIIVEEENALSRSLQDDLEAHDIAVACVFSKLDEEASLVFGADALVIDPKSMRENGHDLLDRFSGLRSSLPVILTPNPKDSGDDLAFDGASTVQRLQKPYAVPTLCNLIGRMADVSGHAVNDHDYVTALVETDRLLPNLSVEFQSKQSLKNDKIVGYEALTRIKTRRALNPAIIFSDLVDVAVEVEATLVVIDESIRLATALAKRGKTVPVSFNCSAILMTYRRFVDALISRLKQADVPPNTLMLEITEESRVVDVDRLAAVCHVLREHGLRISIDDYGTGLANLERIAKIPFDELKLDKTIFDACYDGDLPMSLLTSMLDFCRSRKARSVIEGIETKHHLAQARLLGADFGQGFYWGCAVPPKYFVPGW
ncbi:MAG: EAL domain-containing protein [Sphingorhabdus sp.]|nr:EAL domain-containing protein [Sphingorhabdus sp.]